MESTCSSNSVISEVHNGYLKFLREFRDNNCDLSIQEIASRGTIEWTKMHEREKNKYAKKKVNSCFFF